MANDWVTYIFGNWAGFIVFLLSSIITLIGVTFMGGAFVQLKDTQKFDGSSLKKPDIEPHAKDTGFKLYLGFFKFMYDLLFYHIRTIINGIMYYLGFLPISILLFLLPIGVTLFIPVIYPCMVALTVIGLLIERPIEVKPEDGTTHHFRHLIIPPFSLFSYFCTSCNEDISKYTILQKLMYYLTYSYRLWFYFMVMLMYCFANMISVGVVAGLGWLYFMWFVFVRPLHYDISKGQNDWFFYKKIEETLLNYSNTLLILFSLIYFTGATLYLGQPLRVTALVIFICSILWLLFEYIKHYTEKIA